MAITSSMTSARRLICPQLRATCAPFARFRAERAKTRKPPVLRGGFDCGLRPTGPPHAMQCAGCPHWFSFGTARREEFFTPATLSKALIRPCLVYPLASLDVSGQWPVSAQTPRLTRVFMGAIVSPPLGEVNTKTQTSIVNSDDNPPGAAVALQFVQCRVDGPGVQRHCPGDNRPQL